jgi:hypothetical protein
MTAGYMNIVALYDSLSLVGISLRWEDYEKWASLELLSGKVFFEDRKNLFLPTLLALSTLGLETKCFI